MNFEPQKFFIGLIDFFSVILPGAVLAYLLKSEAPGLPIVDRLAAVGGGEGIAVFLVASYLIGHVVFLVGAYALDKAYDVVRQATLNKQIRDLARHGALRPKWQRIIIHALFKHERDAAVKKAGEIRRARLKALDAASAMNTFQWAKLYLSKEFPDALAMVQRFEADSKFFRSLSVGLVLVCVASLPMTFAWLVDASMARQLPMSGRAPIIFALALVALPLALWRYAEQRHKSTNQAYWAVIALESHKGDLRANVRPPAPTETTHAGGVVFRRRGPKAEFLLVETTRGKLRWVLPKGHIESGESEQEAAIREVLEEAGVWGRIREDLGIIRYTDDDGEAVRTRLYLMEAVGTGPRADRSRRLKWVSHDGACRAVDHPESLATLEMEQVRRLAGIVDANEPSR